jgi:hypothetical protein
LGYILGVFFSKPRLVTLPPITLIFFTAEEQKKLAN